MGASCRDSHSHASQHEHVDPLQHACGDSLALRAGFRDHRRATEAQPSPRIAYERSEQLGAASSCAFKRGVIASPASPPRLAEKTGGRRAGAQSEIYFFFSSGAFKIQRCPKGSRNVAKRVPQKVLVGCVSIFAPSEEARVQTSSTSLGSSYSTLTDIVTCSAGIGERVWPSSRKASASMTDPP